MRWWSRRLEIRRESLDDDDVSLVYIDLVKS